MTTRTVEDIGQSGAWSVVLSSRVWGCGPLPSPPRDTEAVPVVLHVPCRTLKE
ncbi:hypothetical protein ACWDLL_00820 [Streptomyces griseoincarnatus]